MLVRLPLILIESSVWLPTRGPNCFKLLWFLVVKSFGMDKMQLMEPTEGTKAIAVFQRLRRLCMRLNPTNEDEPKATLDVDENQNRPLKKAKTLSAMPTDASLPETLHSETT